MNAATFLACAMLVVTTGANAVELSRNGADAVLSGPIQSGDDHIFHLFLSKPGAPPIRNLYLNSPGGMVFEAYKISELVRAAGITTVVDAARALRQRLHGHLHKRRKALLSQCPFDRRRRYRADCRPRLSPEHELERPIRRTKIFLGWIRLDVPYLSGNGCTRRG